MTWQDYTIFQTFVRIWDLELVDLVTALDNVCAILVKLTVQGQASEQEVHYGQLENGTLSWFTDCGDPVP
ncbi:MAG: hypothetical protein ABFS17_05935 [Chloroflexota bacterium]